MIEQNAVRTLPDHGAMLEKARALVADSVNEDFPIDTLTTPARTEDFYIVWFAKTLGNWKALVSTDRIDGQYWEVTYDGNKKQTYVDHYVKVSNTVVTDEAYASLS